MPDPTSLSFRFLAELFVTLAIKVFGGIATMVRARRTVETIGLSTHPVDAADFVSEPLSIVWLALSTSFGVDKSQILSIDMSPGGYGDWSIRVMTSRGAYEAVVGPAGLLVTISRKNEQEGDSES